MPGSRAKLDVASALKPAREEAASTRASLVCDEELPAAGVVARGDGASDKELSALPRRSGGAPYRAMMLLTPSLGLLVALRAGPTDVLDAVLLLRLRVAWPLAAAAALSSLRLAPLSLLRSCERDPTLRREEDDWLAAELLRPLPR